MKMIKIIALLTVFILSCESPTEPRKVYIDTTGEWISVDSSIELNIIQKDIVLTGTAHIDSIPFVLIGSRFYNDVPTHLKTISFSLTNKTSELVFAGKIFYSSPLSLRGTIKDGGNVKEITFVKQ